MVANQKQINHPNGQEVIPGFELFVLPPPPAPYQIRQETLHNLEHAFAVYHQAATAYNMLQIRLEERRERALASLAADPESTAKIQTHPTLIRHKMKLAAAYERTSQQLHEATAKALEAGVSPVDLVFALSEAIAEGGK